MNKGIEEQLQKLNKKIDILLIIKLAEHGLKLEEISEILKVDERTIRNWIPFRKIKSRVSKNEKEKK